MPRLPQIATSGVRRMVPRLLLAPALLLGAVLAFEATSGRSIASSAFGLTVRGSGATINVAHMAEDSAAAPGVGSEAAEEAEPDAEPEMAAATEATGEALARMHADAESLRLWKLTHAMMYWTHSSPVPSARQPTTI